MAAPLTPVPHLPYNTLICSLQPTPTDTCNRDKQEHLEGQGAAPIQEIQEIVRQETDGGRTHRPLPRRGHGRPAPRRRALPQAPAPPVSSSTSASPTPKSLHRPERPATPPQRAGTHGARPRSPYPASWPRSSARRPKTAASPYASWWTSWRGPWKASSPTTGSRPPGSSCAAASTTPRAAVQARPTADRQPAARAAAALRVHRRQWLRSHARPPGARLRPAKRPSTTTTYPVDHRHADEFDDEGRRPALAATPTPQDHDHYSRAPTPGYPRAGASPHRFPGPSPTARLCRTPRKSDTRNPLRIFF